MGDRKTFEDISVVLQGPVVFTPQRSADVAIDRILGSIRTQLPGAKIVLSTWTGTALGGLDVDDVVLSDDPGPQGPLKKGSANPNNANRQIVSTRAGLARVATKYAAKMRTDCYLTGHGFVDLQREFPERHPDFALFREKIVSFRFFNLNPHALAAMPFHVGDCFQFGLTEDLKFLWSGGRMSDADAAYFVERPHAEHSLRTARVFNPRFAVEQHIFLGCAKTRFAIDCDTIDDASPAAIRQSEAIFASNIVVADPDPCGVAMPKHAHMMNSLQEDFNCYAFADWLALYRKYAAPAYRLPAEIAKPLAKRRLIRAVYTAIRRRDWIVAILEAPGLRKWWGKFFDRLRPGNKRV